jgi:hypothetical protein
MVGGSSINETVQFRNVPSLDRDIGGMISHPNGEHALYKVEPIGFQGFHPATVSRNPDGVYIGQEITLVGYEISRPTGTTPFLGKPYEAQLEVVDQWEMGFWYTGGTFVGLPLSLALEFTKCWAHFPSFASAGAGGAMLMFDTSNSLLGIAISSGTTARGKGSRATPRSLHFSRFLHRDPDYAVRVSHVADWIERNTCVLSSDALPFCPQLVCPSDQHLVGNPWVLLPNGTGSTRGFDLVRVTQWPPPGTLDGAGREFGCVWRVLVEPYKALSDMVLDPPNGTDNTNGRNRRIATNMFARILSSTIAHQYRGRGSVIFNPPNGSPSYVRPPKRPVKLRA